MQIELDNCLSFNRKNYINMIIRCFSYKLEIFLHPVVAVVGQVKPREAWQVKVAEQSSPYDR